METLIIENTMNAPDIRFDHVKHILEIRGESYPENAREFYEPVKLWLERYLDQLKKEEVTFNVELVYFNSSTSKILMNFFDMMEEAAGKGKKITINWIYDQRNENAIEYGEDFKEDLEHVTFNLIAK
jgi:hypothetical protein